MRLPGKSWQQSPVGSAHTAWFLVGLFVCLGILENDCEAQFRGGRRNRMQFSQSMEPGGTRFYIDRNGVPDWERDEEFPEDVFTFVRIMYNSRGGGDGQWRTDYPDSDLNMSFRLQQLTSLKVNPDPIVLELTDPALFNYPFVYFCEPGGRGRGGWGGGLNFSEAEIEAFRRYLENGGFAMFDDFWGEFEWYNFYTEIKRVFPDREPVDIPLEHPVFNAVYELKEKPQVPSINVAQRGRVYGITWERDDAREPHYRGIFDDEGRLMVIICHNTDLGDGWEREGEDEWYFHEFSEKRAYPLGINIIFYAMTH
ncbi:DUF4159 domain-containing protein [Thalassoglobus neptunius]|nr:DUF4159 domain-containing protein [Thalassoglobus neptunius]